MKRISTAEVLQTICSKREAEINNIASIPGRTTMLYSLDDFTKDMLGSELLCDKRTIRTKWDLLVAQEIIVKERTSHSGKVSGLLNLAQVTPFLNSRISALIRAGGERQTHTEEVL